MAHFSIKLENVRTISLLIFSVDCVWSSWGNWEPCSCDKGNRVRYRNIKTPEINYGNPCEGSANQTETCITCKNENKTICVIGFYDNALEGTPLDCQPCNCNIAHTRNNSNICSKTQRGQCPCLEGYAGRDCSYCK